MGSVRKYLADLDRLLEGTGYRIEKGTGHLKVIGPSGKRVWNLPSTPSDRRSWHNAVSDLRRLGIIPKRRESG